MFISKIVDLQRIKVTDLKLLWDWHEKQELYLFERFGSNISFDEFKERFDDYFGWKGDFRVDSKDGDSIGICSYSNITWKNRGCELDFQMCETNPDLSSASDAILTILTFVFNELNMLRVQVFAKESSEFNISVLESNGFVLEGKLRAHLYKNGKYEDVFSYTGFKNDLIKHQGPIHA